MMQSLVAVAASVLAQSPCDASALADGPLMIGFSQADHGVFRRACPRSELGLGAGARAIIEEENFYADLRGHGRLDVSVQPFDALELSLMLEPVFYEQVIQSFRASHLGVGDTSLSAMLLAFTGDRYALSILVRGTLPTAYGYYAHTLPFAFDAGPLFLLEPLDDVRLHAGVLALGEVAITKAASDPRGGIAGNVGADFVIFEWLSIVADLQAQALVREPLDRLTLGFGARAALGDLALELGVAVPVAGADRNAAAGLFRVTARFW